MTDFQEFEAAKVCAARFILSDGREFVFAAYEDEAGLHFSAIEGRPSMEAEDLALVACFQRIDAAGRIVEAIRRAEPSLS
jgi:hypothetical protein